MNRRESGSQERAFLAEGGIRKGTEAHKDVMGAARGLGLLEHKVWDGGRVEALPGDVPAEVTRVSSSRYSLIQGTCIEHQRVQVLHKALQMQKWARLGAQSVQKGDRQETSRLVKRASERWE